MIGTTAIVVDSASYLPHQIRERFGVEVVPMRVTIGSETFREFVDIDSAGFYGRLADGVAPQTSQPPPGEFLDAYKRAAEAGAQAVLSVHIGSTLSGTVNSARLAAGMSPIPVHIVDTGQASFVEGLCAWAACEALEAGASIEEAGSAGLRAGGRSGNVFIVRGLELLERGGRYRAASRGSQTSVPVLALIDGAVSPVGQATTIDEAMELMVAYLESRSVPGARLRIGVSNGAASELASRLEQRILSSRVAGFIDELVQYEVGPSVGAHTGPGCTGIVFQSKEGHGSC